MLLGCWHDHVMLHFQLPTTFVQVTEDLLAKLPTIFIEVTENILTKLPNSFTEVTEDILAKLPTSFTEVTEDILTKLPTSFIEVTEDILTKLPTSFIEVTEDILTTRSFSKAILRAFFKKTRCWLVKSGSEKKRECCRTAGCLWILLCFILGFVSSQESLSVFLQLGCVEWWLRRLSRAQFSKHHRKSALSAEEDENQRLLQSSGAAWKTRWPSWAPRP